MHILHLETSSFFRKIVQQETKLLKEEYFGCSSIAGANKILNSEKIDLILTAQEMTDGTVEDFLKDITETSFRNIPIIMVSSSDNIELRKRFFELGVIDFIHKDSFSINKLKEVIRVMKKQDYLTGELRKASIAVVDDSPFILKVINNILQLQNIINVDLYMKPEELLKSGKHYDIYMVDMFMPGMSGNQLTIRLRKENPMAVIIIISSIDKDRTILQALEAGADDYIMKPFNVDLLTARIRSSFRNFLLMREIEEKRKEMEYLAVTDVLTGASNRRAILQILDKEIQTAKDKDTCLSVMLLDLDRFKLVNDRYGHIQGDRILQSLSKHFLKSCRKDDSFGRYGGEEFLYIMPETPLEDAISICEKLREEFHGTPFNEISPELVLSFSSGLAQWNREDPEAFLQKIDQLLYSAKTAGRNKIKFQ